jgi:hypothetical protein
VITGGEVGRLSIVDAELPSNNARIGWRCSCWPVIYSHMCPGHVAVVNPGIRRYAAPDDQRFTS